jgi:hypothetical protein
VVELQAYDGSKKERGRKKGGKKTLPTYGTGYLSCIRNRVLYVENVQPVEDFGLKTKVPVQKDQPAECHEEPQPFQKKPVTPFFGCPLQLPQFLPRGNEAVKSRLLGISARRNFGFSCCPRLPVI